MRRRRGQALRDLDRRLQQPTAVISTVRRSGSGRSARYAPQNAAIAGRIAASGRPARATSRPGSAGSTIGIDPTQARRYSARTEPASTAGSPRPAPSQSASSSRVRRSDPGAGTLRQFSQRRSPCTSASSHDSAPSSPSRPHRKSLPWTRATRSCAAKLSPMTSACGGSGRSSGQAGPGRGASRGRPCSRARTRPRMRARAGGKRPRCSLQSRARPGVLSTRRPPGSWTTTAGTWPAMPGSAASARRIAASVASDGAPGSLACLTTKVGPARVVAR